MKRRKKIILVLVVVSIILTAYVCSYFALIGKSTVFRSVKVHPEIDIEEVKKLPCCYVWFSSNAEMNDAGYWFFWPVYQTLHLYASHEAGHDEYVFVRDPKIVKQMEAHE